jgi:DNA repair exonuclease SbcCD ATPase subunit
MKVDDFKRFLIEKERDINTLKSHREEIQRIKDIFSENHKSLEGARDIMSRVGILAQQEIKCVIEELVTQALQSVFGPEYAFEVDSRIQRNKPEVNFYVVIDGYRHHIKGELGGGVVDLAAFSLRVVLWAINSPRTSNVIVLDEPLKFVDKTRLEQVGVMIKKLSEMLGIQFIVVTHEDQLIDTADRAYLVEKISGISKVTKVV